MNIFTRLFLDNSKLTFPSLSPALRDTCLTAPQNIFIICDNQSSICSRVFTLFSHIISLLLVNMSAICLKTMHCREGEPCTVLWSGGVKTPTLPPDSMLMWCLLTRCVHLRSQDSSYGGRLLSSGVLAASSLRCNRNNPIKWWIAFHTDYWASVTPAGGGRDKVAPTGRHTHIHVHTWMYRPAGNHSHMNFNIL